jgi:hypothetical protein
LQSGSQIKRIYNPFVAKNISNLFNIVLYKLVRGYIIII